MAEQNYNALFLRGADVTDLEYVEEFNIPREAAHTKQINDYMLDIVQTKNQEQYEREGMERNEALNKARYERMKAEQDIEILYELNNLK